jgi:hypothetical protein
MAIRSIEESNPDIEFDWTRILKEQGTSESSGQSQRPPNVDRRISRRSSEPKGARPTTPHEAPVRETPPASAAAAPVPDQMVDSVEPAPAVQDQPAAFAPLEAAEAEEKTLTPAHARLGAEGVLRLRARHAEILARISERIADSARQDELKAQAERLNPDTWVTDDEVRAGLEGYESVLESLRAVVGQGRRRRRRGGQSREGSASVPETSSAGAPDRATEPGNHAIPDGGPDDDAEPEEEPV